ncbi:MAG: NMD3-related protein [Candidatus Methanomethylicaceae archaeon]|nr:NMD3-related protein [Candidatus Verstraetearchaeota archaeon]
MFCAKCGKRNIKLITNLCEECFWESREVKIPSEVKIIVCPICSSYLRGKKWIRKENLKSAIIEGCIYEIKKLSKLNKDLKITNITIEEYPIIKLKIEVSFENFSKIFISESKIIYQKCDYCRKVSQGKYEAIVQIRGWDKKTLSLINPIIEEFKIINGKPEISEIKEVVNGIDIKFMSVNKARLFTKRILEKMNVEIKETAKISGMKEGELHYITTISIRAPPIKIGKIICIGDKIFRILEFHKGKIIAEDLENEKIVNLNRNDVEKSLIIEDMREVIIKSINNGIVKLLDIKEGKDFEIPINNIQKGMKEGEFGILITFKDREYVLKKTL